MMNSPRSRGGVRFSLKVKPSSVSKLYNSFCRTKARACLSLRNREGCCTVSCHEVPLKLQEPGHHVLNHFDILQHPCIWPRGVLDKRDDAVVTMLSLPEVARR